MNNDMIKTNCMINQNIILTGDRPTGSLHLGHYVGSLKSRVALQHSCKQFILIADMQALTDNFERPKFIKNNILQLMAAYMSVELNPDKNIFVLQSAIPELAELTIHYMNLVHLGRLQRNPTVKHEIEQKSLENSLSIGFLCYPISQAADITAFKANLVPVGQDQVPMIEQTNEIVRKFNRLYYTNCLKECKPYLSDVSRLMGINGAEKAGKSTNNAIFLNESSKSLKEKVFSMYTDSNHIKISDPGQVEGNVVFAYLDAFYNNIEHLNELKQHYKKGGLGDVYLKKLLFDTLENFIAPVRDKYNQYSNDELLDILRTGTEIARKVAKNTLSEIRQALCLTNFKF